LQEEIPRHIVHAIDYGIIHPEYTLEDYLIHAVDNNGYETVCIHGTQGSGKSNRMLQIGAWVMFHVLKKRLGQIPTEKEIWEAVLELIVFKPSTFVTRLEEVPRGERLPILLWDDIGVHYTSSTFKTDITQYSAVDATWAAIRTKVAVVVVTIPIIGRLAKNVKDNLTFEIFLGRNQKEQVRRLFYLPGTQRIDSNLFKPILGEPEIFDLYIVPQWVWNRYWDMRLDLTEEALAILKGATDMEDIEGYIPVIDASLKAREMGYKISPSTIQQNISRAVLKGRKINGELCVQEEHFKKYLQSKERL